MTYPFLNHFPLLRQKTVVQTNYQNDIHHLESFIWFCILQKTIGIESDKTFLTVLRTSEELREFCGSDDVPDGSKITRFKQDFVRYIEKVFENLIEVTEPICRHAIL